MADVVGVLTEDGGEDGVDKKVRRRVPTLARPPAPACPNFPYDPQPDAKPTDPGG
jgi:hypothetical protein